MNNNLILNEELFKIRRVMGIKNDSFPLIITEAEQSVFDIAASLPGPPPSSRSIEKLLNRAKSDLENIKVNDTRLEQVLKQQLENDITSKLGRTPKRSSIENWDDLVALSKLTTQEGAVARNILKETMQTMTNTNYQLSVEFTDVYFDELKRMVEYFETNLGLTPEAAKKKLNDNLKAQGFSNVATAFDQMYSDYLLVKAQAPIELNTTSKIEDFQNWLDREYPDWTPTKKMKNKDLGYGELDGVTATAWAKYNRIYKSQLKIAEVIRNTPYGEIQPEEMTLLDRFFSTEIQLTKGLRVKIIGPIVKRLLNRNLTNEEIVKKILGKIETVLDLYVKSLSTTSGQIPETLLRDISADMYSLTNSETSLEGLYSEIEDYLYKNVNPAKRSEVSDVMKIIRKQNPWSKDLPYGGNWIARFVDESTWGRAASELRNKETSRLTKFGQILERFTAFSFIGASKSMTDWTELYANRYGKDAKIELVKHLYLAKFVGIPLFISLMKTIGYAFGSLVVDPEREKRGFWEMFGNNLLEYWKGIFIRDPEGKDPSLMWDIAYAFYGALPVHQYIWDMIDSFGNFVEEIYQQKKQFIDFATWTKKIYKRIDDYMDKKEKALNEMIDNKEKEMKKEIDDYMRKKYPETYEKIKELQNSTESFQEWVKSKGYQFDRYENGVGYTKDGKSYIYDDTDKTNPKFREPKIDGTESGFKDWAKINQKEFDKVTPTGIGVSKDGTQYEWDGTSWEEI